MAQKSHPNSLRINPGTFQGCAYWNETQFNHTTYSIYKVIKACCRKTDVYLDKAKISLYHDSVYVEANFVNLYSQAKRRGRSRRHKENTKEYIRKHTKDKWKIVLRRIHFSIAVIQKFTGLKTIHFKINRLKAFSRSIPKSARQQMQYYYKIYNKKKFFYARPAMQLLSAALRGKTNAMSLAVFIRENMRTNSRQRKHMLFLRFLKHALKALKKVSKVRGLKIQIKGRFGPRPKSRSRIWKHQIGKMTFSKITTPLHAEYVQAQTVLGSVGIKVWICYNDPKQTNAA